MVSAPAGPKVVATGGAKPVLRQAQPVVDAPTPNPPRQGRQRRRAIRAASVFRGHRLFRPSGATSVEWRLSTGCACRSTGFAPPVATAFSPLRGGVLCSGRTPRACTFELQSALEITSSNSPDRTRSSSPALPCGDTVGCQPRICLARVMSGQRTFGSSGGIGWWMILLLLSGISARISLAICRIVTSSGLPRLIGSMEVALHHQVDPAHEVASRSRGCASACLRRRR